eukprot:CAMPEP_0202947226 /NCGR_PEP_ID=MMETSP1395-20130829/11189_1 /ASSEMBLY_ACC=CAM_ASM_000871 /TAXON_ID=5961 /ORGANISM="Blepharisma japonicum, Strain Stock R1072" /LENGTH=402 /DNA_ID=CAMNT_0049648359 /DNA_START=154 /DNA_END=1362 /DNA_ORIENTATION=+
MKRLGGLLRKDHENLARLMTQEMGKPIGQSKGEVLKCADCCDYYADNAEKLLAPTHYDIPGSKVYVNYEPLGPLFIIMPFNFPLWMPLKCGIPHLMAGNTIILKHAENVPQVAEALDRITSDAGFEHEFKNVFIDMEQVQRTIADNRIRGVSLTGSIRAGRSIASMAGMALKKCVLELGGSDPFIVLGDADVQAAAKTAVMARLQGCGQVCISAKRFIVESSVYSAFVKHLIAELKTWQYGDPLNPETKLGPLARPDLLNNVVTQVERSIKMGAKLEYGGKILNPTQYEPAVLTHVTPDMPIMREETFGPVFAISKVKDTEEAIRLANNTEFGLGAMIFTADAQRAEAQIVPRIDAGMVFVNDVSKSIVQVPFGGMKNSGLGRELGEGIKEFTVLKTISIKK